MAMRSGSWILLVVLMNTPVGNGQSVQMDPEVSDFVGTTVELSCLFINSKPPVKISQVTWQKSFNGTKQNVAIANPALGVSVLPAFKDRVWFKHLSGSANPSLEDTTIVFSNLRLSDEAAYICEYTTFPAGNRENMVNLTVYARPVTHMTLTTPIIIARAQKHKMTVATCLSANGKPPSVIKWDTQLKGEATFQETRNPNGTVTTRSNYVIVPSRESHRQKLTCIVTYKNEHISDSVILNVQYEPEVKIDGFDGNWYLNRQDVKLTCDADANPPVTGYHWKVSNGSLPKNVEIRNNTLFFRGPVTYDFTGIYICDATNSIGTRSGLVEVNVTEKPLAQGPPGGLLGILGLLVVFGLIVGVMVTIFMVYKRGQKTQSDTDNDLTEMPPMHKPVPPPPKKNSDMKGGLISDDIQVVLLDKENELLKVPLHPPYNDKVTSESTAFTDKPNPGTQRSENLATCKNCAGTLLFVCTQGTMTLHLHVSEHNTFNYTFKLMVLIYSLFIKILAMCKILYLYFTEQFFFCALKTKQNMVVIIFILCTSK
ncbi:nectin cell adhesion molecule 1b isoform X1 [Silurus meridionalis]|uniref:nectin cell adhesion molecule 1b isoform X1 n=1 Tax=Silurus meridionalis TaxID=175797 RepID=UPI001EEA96EF|nr:nectin cell adhesion molecule 1b isoform X1 [Silurus meridionalis]